MVRYSHRCNAGLEELRKRADGRGNSAREKEDSKKAAGKPAGCTPRFGSPGGIKRLQVPARGPARAGASHSAEITGQRRGLSVHAQV